MDTDAGYWLRSAKILQAWKIFEDLAGGKVEPRITVAGCLVFFQTPAGTAMVNLDLLAGQGEDADA